MLPARSLSRHRDRRSRHGERSRRWVGVIAVAAVLLGACGDDSTADPEAFCELLANGVGIGSDQAEIDPEGFAALEAVAPEEIADAVRQLGNTARDLDQIADTDLDDLFAAAFDPDARAARAALVAYADAECGVPAEAIVAGRLADDDELRTELATYVQANFESEDWATVVTFDFERVGGSLEGVDVRFAAKPRRAEVEDSCQAVSVWLYEIAEGGGAVRVYFEDQLEMERSGPDESCESR